MPKASKPKRAKFDYSLDFKTLDMRQHPGLYRIGLGEQGVLSVEPYKSEILPLWRFKTPEIARTSSFALRDKFLEYLEQDDFIGMDMTRKFIQMGVTRSRRYANWAGGKKYTGEVDKQGKKIKVTKGPEDEVKAESARIFGKILKEVQDNEEYHRMAEFHRLTHEADDKQVKVKDQVKDQKHHVKTEEFSEDLQVASSNIKQEDDENLAHCKSENP